MRMYVSGPKAALLSPLNGGGINVRVMSERIGDASAIKMCYASYTKGAVALGVEMLMAARRMGSTSWFWGMKSSAWSRLSARPSSM